MAKIENKFNDLGPKEWLPFQKSFTQFQDMESLIESNLRFFTKPSCSPLPNILTFGSNEFVSTCSTIGNSIDVSHDPESDTFDFLAVDLTTNDIQIHDALNWIIDNCQQLNYRKFLWVLLPTNSINNDGFPVAWSLSNELSHLLTRKDEKIICLPNGETWTSLYFRKDEHAKLNIPHPNSELFINESALKSISIKNWFILKPKPRSKDEILHPAKYPEDLVELYVNEFTQPDDTVFDPMSGTGTTQVSSIQLGRNAYGIELSELFHGIATQRCKSMNTNKEWAIFQGDARDIQSFPIPNLDYIITSPPYWDMLNMKGAEIQAARKAKGLQTNYSDNENDLGNMSDYSDFLNLLLEIYHSMISKLNQGGHVTIVVKNIKKKGNHYPLAFDLCDSLVKDLQLVHIGFWCQDDLQIAPYGYKHTWVSNTFHHYCLTFQKV